MGLFRPKLPREYPSFILWFFDQTHVTVTAITASAIFVTIDPHVVWFSIGALGSSLMAKATKRLIRQSRPSPEESSVPSPVRPKKTYGMPSTHSTALSFYFFYLIPLILSPSNSTIPNSSSSSFISHQLYLPVFNTIDLSKSFHSIPFLSFVTVYWIGGIWTRVKLGYHTWEQIGGGLLLGAILAGSWRGVWENSEIVRSSLCQLIDFGWSLVLDITRFGLGRGVREL